MVETAMNLGAVSTARPRPDARANSPVENRSIPPNRNIPVIPGLGPRENLLIWQHKQDLENAIKNHSTIILAAGTGTGKTRGGSQIALEALGQSGKMIVTENLRRATEESAKVVAADMQVEIGKEVGIQNRYTHKTSDETRLLFCPVQSLLIKMEADPLLTEYSMVAMDEVHKESKANELCMISLRDIQTKRTAAGLEPLKLMFISATADREKITAHFPDAVTVDVPGKTFPVDEVFETASIPVTQLPAKAAEKVKMSVDSGDHGNILVFLSGQKQIDEAGDALSGMNLKDVEVIRYYGAAPKEEQERMFSQSSKRKVVLATNAAQESLTLDVNIVVDTGMHKHMELDTDSGRQYLTEQKAPKDHLIQRRGRVGRKESPHPYKYYALMTKSEWDSRPEHEAAEMQRTDLTQEMLILLAQGHKDLYGFKYINPPDRRHIDIALKRLSKIGAIEAGQLTAKGELMATMQLKPNLSSMVASGIRHGSAGATSALASMMETYPNALEEKQGSSFQDTQSDAVGLINVFNAYRQTPRSERKQWAKQNGFNEQKLRDASDLYDELKRTIQEKSPGVSMSPSIDRNALDRAIAEGFADSIVRRGSNGKYHMTDVIGDMNIDKSSILHDKKTHALAALDMKIIVPENERHMKRVATINHPLSEASLSFNAPGEKTAPATLPTSPAIPEPDTVPHESIPAAKPLAPPLPPVKPPTLGERIKTWVNRSWVGKVLRWITA